VKTDPNCSQLDELAVIRLERIRSVKSNRRTEEQKNRKTEELFYQLVTFHAPTLIIEVA